MSSFDDYRKKLEEKYGTPEKTSEKEDKKTKKVKTDSSFYEYHSKLMEKYSSKATSSDLENWLTDADATLRAMQEYHTQNEGKYTPQYGGEMSQKIKDLMYSSGDIYSYLQNHKSEIGNYDEVSRAFAEYRNVLQQNQLYNYNKSRYYSQFESEDAYNKWYEDNKKVEEYKSVLDAEDFEKYSYLGKRVKNPDWKDAHAPFEIFGWTPFGDGDDIGNMVTFAEANGANAFKASASSMIGGGRASEYQEIVNLINGYMEDDEKKIYNYYVGKGDTEKANEYLAYITDILRQRQGGVIAKNADGKWVEPVLSGAAGLDQWFSGVGNLDNFLLGKEPDEDISSLNYAFQEMSGNNEGLWKVANDLAHTTGNMAPSIIVGTLTGGIGGALTLGTSAMGNAYADMKRLGYEDGAAQNYAFLVGASETALSYFLGGISKLGGGSNGIFQTVASKIVPKLDNAIARVAIQVGGNMLDEGLEEALQEVLDPIFKMVTTGEDFEGIDIEQVLYSGLLGALSAGVLEGGPTVAGTALQSNQMRETYGGMTLGAGIQAFKENKKLSDVSKAFKEGKSTQTQNASDLVAEAIELDPENAHAQRMQARLEAGKDVSGYQINRLIEANQQVRINQDKAKIKSAVEAELTKLGETGDVGKIADVITKIRAGEDITKAESKVLTESKYGRRVSMTSNPEIIEQGGFDTAWAEKIGTEVINEKAYNKGLHDLAEEVAGVTADENIPSATNNTPAKEIATESEFKASEDGKTRIGDMEVSVKEIASVKDGRVVLRLDDDSTVDARDVDFGSADAVQLYENVAHMGWTPDVANSFVKGYDGSMPVNNYAQGFSEAYRFGELGIPMVDVTNGVFSSGLPEATRNLAYGYGKADAKVKIEAKQAKIASVGTNKAGNNASLGKKKGGLHNTLKPTNETQRASLKTLGVLADTLGIDIYTFESKEVNGKRQGANGWYDPTDNSIHIDLFAGSDGKGTMLFTAAHELTHHIREKLPTKFKAFADFLFEQYAEKGISVSGLIEAKIKTLEANGRTKGKTEAEIYDLAYEEVVADSCESFLADGEAVAKIAELKAKDKTLWQTIKDFINNLVARIKAAYEGLSPDSVEGRYVAEMLDNAEKLKAMWTEMVVEASEVETTTELLGKNGILVDATTNSATLYSVRDVLSDADRKKVSKSLAERFDVTQSEAMDWLKAETSLASLILNPKYSQYLDYTADPNEEAIKSNSDYPQGTVDFSNICKKRRDFTEVMNRVLRNFPHHVFAATDLAKIRTIMEQEGMEVAYAICYVEDRRQLDSVVAQNFIDSLALYREGSKTKPDGTPFNANQLKAFSLIEGDTYTPSIYELISLEGRNSLKAKNPAMEEAWVKFNNARGMQSVRLLLNDAEYKRQILKYSQSVVKRKNDLGGLRIYSFSDMEMFHLIDIIQVITDSATVGLSLQGYTKVNEYAKAVKDTGEKLNRSLIPKGDLGYHMEDGKVVLDFDTTEGIDINHPDFFDNIDNPNIGNIVIGINATQIKAAMTSKFIDQIIPFHTGQSNEVLGEKGIAAWDNYKDFQSERDVKTNKKSSHQINIYTEVINAAEAEGNPITNKVDFVNKFLEVCRENNLIPRFSDFLNVDENGNYVYTEGYHKFLVDFKTFDQNTGEYLPQKPVKPVFDNEYITSLLMDYVKSQKVKDAEVTKAMPKVLDRITKEIVKSDGVKFSDRDSNGNELSKEQTEFFKDSKVRDADGNLMVVYHGTANGGAFTVFDGDKLGNESRTTQIGQGFYFTNMKNEAEAYMQNVDIYGKASKGSNPHLHQVYLNITNPFDVNANQLDLNRVKAVYSDGTYDYFFNNWIPFYLNNKTVNGKRVTKSEVQTMSKAEKVSAYVDYLASLGTKEVLSNMVRAFPYGKQGELLTSMKKHLGHDGIVEEFSPGQYQYVAFSPEQVKLTSNQNPTSNTDIRYSDRTSYAPAFYSYMGKVVDGIKLDKMGANGVVSYLKGKGVKNEEIKWSGIEAWLEGKKSVTKAELQEFIAGSQLAIEEEMSGSAVFVDEDGNTYTDTEFKDRAYAIADEEGIDRSRVKFILDADGEGTYLAYAGNPLNGQLLIADLQETNGMLGRWGQYKIDGGTNYRELVLKMPDSSYSNRAMRVHWGEDAEGVLAHARIQDITTKDGKKMLFIEEIQSDWHNEGHQKGYTTKEYEDAVAVYDKLAEDYANKRRAFNKYVRSGEFRSDPDEVSKKKFDWLRSKMDTAEKRMHDAERGIEALKKKGMGDVPDVPFRDTYHEYVLKRLLRMAAEEGYDAIGWTPADIQSERWSDEFAEAYRIEYDQDIPKFLRKYGKKWGATVGTTTVADTEVWSMDIPDSMKDSVLHEGQVLYSDRNFASQVDAVLNGADTNSTHLKLMDTPSLLQEAGLPNLPVLMTANHLKKITATTGHGLDVEMVKKLPEYISSPVMIADSLTRADSVVIITEAIDSENRPVIAAIMLNGKGQLDNQYVDANIMTSAYGRNNFQSFLDRIADGNSVIYWDKEKSQDLSVNLGVQFPNVITSLDSGVIIHQAKAFVNAQNKKNLQSDRPAESVSNRSLLANALESVAQNDIERNKLSEYKAKIALIEAEQKKLSEIRAKIKELSFAKGPRDAEAIKKLQFTEKQTANRINTYDRQLLTLEATTALKGVLDREKKLAYKRAEQKGKEALAAYREKATKTQRELLTRYQESRKKGVEGRKQTAMRLKVKNIVNELNQYLLKGTKEKHVPIELQGVVAEALAVVNMDTVGAEERIAKLREELRVAKSLEDMQKITKKIEHISEIGGNMEAKIARLKTAYDNIVNSDDPLIANSHDAVISSSIEKVIEVVGDTPIRDMSLYQLEAVYDMYKMVLTSIRNTNKAFKAAKNAEISTIANGVISELMDQKRKTPYSSKAKQTMSEFDWNNLKPVYAFERIGSANFTTVFDAVREGEDVWAKDMSEAQAFREEQFQKYKYDSWDFDKRFGFISTSGNGFELSLDQIMSLYAFSKREQAGDHLKYGGFVFDGLTEVKVKNKAGRTKTYQLKDATAYNLSEETLAEIIGKLTPEQKAFVDVMQDYLSTVMGEKGNEVSLALYDVKLFKEKYYFPLKSAPQYLAKAKEQAQGDVKVKNSGFTKETAPKAKNPIVLSSFMDVWAGHVNDMSMYHAFVLPLEDFYRVYNYHTPANEKMEMMSVGASLENAHGQAAVNYIDQLLKDLNGGARSDPRDSFGKALMAKFKKASVMASLSVVIQQPSAIVRAQALVDAKYFVGTPSGKHRDNWAEVKKYAPVAIIKEMGYFDTGMGKSSVAWLKGEKTLMDKVDDATSKLPALADEVTWVAIWNAVKRETLHTHKNLRPNSEEFLKAAGERFTEVIVKTQVYDSTLARSANMRSKSTWMNMVTSFMAEPTTSINLLQDSFRKGKRGKYTLRVMGAVYGSVLLNSALVSIVYAMRDDDEDETFLEKYLSRFTTEVIDGVIPLTSIPLVKDVWSLLQGYDIERADMSLISDVVASLQQMVKLVSKDTSDMDEEELAEHRKAINEAVLKIMGSLSSCFGVPLKNVLRDLNGIINAFKTIKKDVAERDTTAGSLGDNVLEDVKDSVPVWGWFPDESKGDKLYDAIVKGDTAYVDRLKGGYKTGTAYQSAVRKALRENDPRIKEAAEARCNGNIAEYMRIAKAIIAEGNFKQDDVVSAINTEITALKKGEETAESTSSDKVTSIYKLEDYYDALAGRDQATAYVVKEDLIKVDVANGKNREEAEADFNSKFESHLRELFEDGDISASEAERMLSSYGGKSEEDASSKVQYWEFKKRYPDYDLSEEAVEKYYNEVEPYGIGVGVYYDYSKQRAKCKGADSDGDGKTDSGSVKREVLAVIDSLPITYKQKDALYYLNGWSASTIREAPWH